MSNQMSPEQVAALWLAICRTWPNQKADEEGGGFTLRFVMDGVSFAEAMEAIKALAPTNRFCTLQEIRQQVEHQRNEITREANKNAPLCSLCFRPASSNHHDVVNYATAHPYDPPKPRRVNHAKAPQVIARPWRAGIKENG